MIMKYAYIYLILTIPCALINERHLQCRGQPEADDLLSDSNPRSRPVVVNIPGLGKVQGRRDGPIDFFGGLPFAAPPVGNLRWAPPEVCVCVCVCVFVCECVRYGTFYTHRTTYDTDRR